MIRISNKNSFSKLFASEDSKTRQTFIKHVINFDLIENDCLELILVKCYPDPQSLESPKPKNKYPSKLKLSIIGLGEYNFDEDMLKFLIGLEKLNYSITSLFLYDLEIKPKILPKLLDTLEGLSSLEVVNCPLDTVEVLRLRDVKNKSIKYLNLSYTDPDFVAEGAVSLKEGDSKYNFLPNFTALNELHVVGVALEPIDFKAINSIGRDIKRLGVENIKTWKDHIFEFIQNISKNFPDLELLSLAANDLEKIAIPMFDNDFLPKSLKSLNLNNTGLSTSQLGLFLSRNKGLELEEIYFRGNLISGIQKSPAIFNLFNKNIGIVDASSNPLSQDDVDTMIQKFGDTLDISLPKSKVEAKISKDQTGVKSLNHLNIPVTIEETEEINKQAPLDDILKENHRALKNLAEEVFEETKKDQTSLQKKSDFLDQTRVILKAMRYTDRFFQRKENTRTDYITDYTQVIASSDLNRMDELLPTGFNGHQQLGIHDTPLIKMIMPFVEKITRDDAATGSFNAQIEFFANLMESIGYPPLTRYIEEEDCEEQLYRVLIPDNTVSHDYRIVMFSLRWYKGFEQVNLEFCLSDDWFLPRNERVNRISIQNQDISVNLLNSLNNHIKDFSFHFSSEAWDRESENPDDSEEIYFIDAGFKKNFLFLDKMNLTKEIIASIDQGFILLKMINEEDIYDMDLQPENYDEWSMSFWKAAKNNLRKYRELKEFGILARKI